MNIHDSVQKRQHLANSLSHTDPVHNLPCYSPTHVLILSYAASWTTRGSNHPKNKRVFFL